MAFQCPRCGRTSHHPDDGKHGYCGACHAFTGDGNTRRLIIAAGLDADAPVTAPPGPDIPHGRLAAPGLLRAVIERRQLAAAPEPAQLPPGLPALAAEPDGTAYDWHPGDPVLLKSPGRG
jgi:hypothetical protein